MAALGLPKAFIKAVRRLYEDATVQVYINGYASRRVAIRAGVRQGDPLSYPLFVIVIEFLALTIN